MFPKFRFSDQRKTPQWKQALGLTIKAPGFCQMLCVINEILFIFPTSFKSSHSVIDSLQYLHPFPVVRLSSPPASCRTNTFPSPGLFFYPVSVARSPPLIRLFWGKEIKTYIACLKFFMILAFHRIKHICFYSYLLIFL